MKKDMLTIKMTEGLHYIDTVVEGIADIFYDKENDIFYKVDYRQKVKIKLVPKIYDSNKGGPKIYAKVRMGGNRRIQWAKTVSQLLFDHFGIVTDDLKHLPGWSIEIYKDKVLEFYKTEGYILKYCEMRYHENIFWRCSYHSFIRNFDGVSTYHNINKELGIIDDAKYFDHNLRHLRSSYEFITFSILHFNGIEYQYEPFNVENRVPDFYVKKDNLIIEILGVKDTLKIDYSSISILKNSLYPQHGYNYLPVTVDHEHPKKSIFNSLKTIYKELKEPNYVEYYLQYTLKGEEFLKELKTLLIKVNSGELQTSAKYHRNTFQGLYPYFHKFCLENFGSVYDAVLELLGIESETIHVSTGYWYQDENMLRKTLKICDELGIEIYDLTTSQMTKKFPSWSHITRNRFNNCKWLSLKKHLIKLYNQRFPDKVINGYLVSDKRTFPTQDNIRYIRENVNKMNCAELSRITNLPYQIVSGIYNNKTYVL
jgi:hypothetical protein